MVLKSRKYSNLNFDEAIASVESNSGGPAQLEKSINSYIFYAVFGAVFFFGLVGITRLSHIGVVRGSFYETRAESNVNRQIPIIAPRGIITDRNGKPLVENKLVFSLFLRVSDMVKNSEKEQVLNALRDILKLREEEIIEKLERADLENINDIILAQDISREETIKINALNLSSLYVENDYKRDYLDKAFSHVIGYVGLPNKNDLAANPRLSLVDSVGRAGLEKYYDGVLQGQNGLRVSYRNLKRIEGSEGVQIIREPKIGGTLQTTIDADLQKYFYDRLVYNTQLRGQTNAVGIAMNPKTGEILSLVSLPSYDANNIGKYLNAPNQPLFNRAVSGVYNPGSTVKPMEGAVALQEGIISPNTQIYSRGFIEVPNPYDPSKPSRFVDHFCCGWVDLAKSIAVSSNVYFYAVGGGLPQEEASKIVRGGTLKGGIGISRLNQYWKMFGLADRSGVDLPGEAISFLPNPEEKQKRTGSPWRLGDTYNVSIGQGDMAITMVQLADYVAAIANKGIAYIPHIKKTDSPKMLLDLSEFREEFEAVEKGMVDSIFKSYGTSHAMSDIPFKVAAKTGTAQTNFNTRTNALFVGYGPVDAKGGPEIEVVVLIENAKEGSLNAIPVAKDVLNWYYENRLTKLGT